MICEQIPVGFSTRIFSLGSFPSYVGTTGGCIGSKVSDHEMRISFLPPFERSRRFLLDRSSSIVRIADICIEGCKTSDHLIRTSFQPASMTRQQNFCLSLADTTLSPCVDLVRINNVVGYRLYLISLSFTKFSTDLDKLYNTRD